jgi:hypothetical protein
LASPIWNLWWLQRSGDGRRVRGPWRCHALTRLGGEGRARGLGVGVGATDHGRGVHPRVHGQSPWVGRLAAEIPLLVSSAKGKRIQR